MAKVEIYTRGLCGYCTRAKGLLTRRGVAFREIDAGQSLEARAEMEQRSGGARTFPQIFINDQHIGGCDDLMGLEKNGRLAALLSAPGDNPDGQSGPVDKR